MNYCALIFVPLMMSAHPLHSLFPKNPLSTALANPFHPEKFSNSAGVKFSCNRMTWEKAPQLLTLEGNISIQDKGIGNIHCEKEVELRQKENNGKWEISHILAKGKTQLHYLPNSPLRRLLICYGLMQLDQEKLILTFESPPSQPIEYYHNAMKLSADTAQIDYTKYKEKIDPRHLHLSGNVHLVSEEDTSRCALADAFSYFPQEEKMILFSKKGSNVLFWDEEKQLSVSAKEVHITRLNEGEHIKGIGNVRFTFSSTENALLKKIFPFYQPKEEPK